MECVQAYLAFWSAPARNILTATNMDRDPVLLTKKSSPSRSAMFVASHKCTYKWHNKLD